LPFTFLYIYRKYYILIMKSVIKLSKKITTKENFWNLLNIWRFKEEKIVFTSGFFNQLSLKDITYLSESADLGTKLVVGLYADQSEGAESDQNARAHIIASLFYVDAVIICEEDSPEDLISFINPDILLEGV
jgi:bifunctional ADP-heptose synthase (sugar kinase/adenylyltransferase)